MSYRKFKADYLFDGYSQLDHSHVLVTDGDGTIREIVDDTVAGEGVETMKGLLSPGFINCHCHLELSHLKSLIPVKTGLVDFVFSVVSQRKVDQVELLSHIRSAEEEMLAAGIVAVGDICNTTDTLAQKEEGNICYYNFIELAGWLPVQAQSRFNAGKALYKQFEESNGRTAHLSINPHAPYSVSAGLWDLLKAGFPHKTITIHNQETAGEDVFFISASGELTRLFSMMHIDSSHFSAPGIGSLPYYLHQLREAENILLVHNTFTTKKDLALATAFHPNLFFCLCPNANLYIEDHLPDIPAMIQLGANIVIGTDSLASNHQLSILEEIKTIKKKFPFIKTETLLQWATSNGAHALQYENKLGDFKKGKKPGIVLIEYKGEDPVDNESSCRRIL